MERPYIFTSNVLYISRKFPYNGDINNRKENDETMHEELPEDYIKSKIETVEEGESIGIWERDPLSVKQEHDLYLAASTLSNLMKETNSSLSELLEMSGFTWET